MSAHKNLQYHSLVPERWKDFEKLFGERGACGGCWCMWWRLTHSDFLKQRGDQNKIALKKLVDEGKAPGILAYANDQPIGWCAVNPREEYPVLDRSRILKRVDDKPVWSVTCFFVHRQFRNQGVSLELLKAAITHARKNGAKIVEGYPIEPKKRGQRDPFVFTGLASTFRKAGFTEVLRRSETRPIMRLVVKQ